MNTSSVNSTNNPPQTEVRQPAVQAQAKAVAQVQPEVTAQVINAISSRPETLSASKTSTKTGPRAGNKTDSKPATDEKTDLPLSNGSNVSILFRVDDKTKDLTVYVVDRQSKKVLRTIPPDVLNKLSAGDLVKLTA